MLKAKQRVTRREINKTEANHLIKKKTIYKIVYQGIPTQIEVLASFL